MTFFKRFGEVEAIWIHSKRNVQYAFVRFKTEETTMKVVSRSPHWISNCIVRVRAVDLHQTEQDALILNTLNDDCLRDIFKYFDLFVLTNVADDCVHFNRIAKEAFPSNHKHVQLSSIL